MVSTFLLLPIACTTSTRNAGRARPAAQRDQRALALRLDFSQARRGPAREIAAELRPHGICAADELARGHVDLEGRAMTVDHPHVSAIALEPHQLVGAVSEA